MPISMSLSAHYVTQSSMYTCPYTGPLTDRKIAKYQKQGRLPRSVDMVKVKRRAPSLRELLLNYK